MAATGDETNLNIRRQKLKAAIKQYLWMLIIGVIALVWAFNIGRASLYVVGIILLVNFIFAVMNARKIADSDEERK